MCLGRYREASATPLLGNMMQLRLRRRDAAKKERHPQCPALINLLVQVRIFIAQAVATPPFAIRTMSITSIMAICTTLMASISMNTLLKCPK